MANEAALPASGALETSEDGGRVFRALRNRNYRLFYFGQMVSLTGTWMQMVAQAWLVLEMTDSKAALGTVAMLQFLPITIFVLWAGVIADRVPKRPFILGTQALAMMQALVLTALVWSGNVQLWQVYSLAFLLGIAQAFEQPARQAFVVEMVGKEDLMNAVALNSGLFNAARLVGPAIGGVIIATVGVKGAFLLNGISFVPVIAALLMMNAREFHAPPARKDGPVHPVRELIEGLSYAFRTPTALFIVILVGFIGTFGYNFTVVLALVDRYVLDAGSVGLGFLTSAVGVGAVISALVLARRARATRTMLFVSGIAFAVLLSAVAVSRWFPLTFVVLLALGFASTSFNATANTSLQLSTPDHLRGRVMALYMLLFAGSTPIGALFTGLVSEHTSVTLAVGLEAVMCLVGVAVAGAYYLTHREQLAEDEFAGASRVAQPGRA